MQFQIISLHSLIRVYEDIRLRFVYHLPTAVFCPQLSTPGTSADGYFDSLVL